MLEALRMSFRPLAATAPALLELLVDHALDQRLVELRGGGGALGAAPSNDPFARNTDRVSLLASRWSLDPTTIDPRLLSETRGIAGEVSRSRTRS